MENFNIGLNLKENGLLRSKGSGIHTDAEVLATLVKRLKPAGAIKLVGHSRGAAVAAVAAEIMVQKKIRVSDLKLYSPYIEYIWQVSYMPTVSFNFFLDTYPGLVGRGIDMGLRLSTADSVIGLSDSKRQKGYAYVLGGIHPYMGYSYKLADSLKALSDVDRLNIQIYAVQNDDKLSPLDKAIELDNISGVDVIVFEDSEMTHYWPLEDPDITNNVSTN